ncbi:MAG: WD40 repeat domain-containing protein, partial [Planctomycetota bacterium]
LACGEGPRATKAPSSLEVLDARTGNRTATLVGHRGFLAAIAFSCDGSRLAAGAEDGTVRIWDPARGTLLRELPGHGDLVWSVAFAPGGAVLASGSWDGTVRVWHVETGEEQRVLPSPAGRVYPVAFSEDGALLACGSLSGAVRLWETSGYEELATLSGHEGGVLDLEFAREDTLLISASMDETVRGWSTDELVLRPTSAHRGTVGPAGRLAVHREGTPPAFHLALRSHATGEALAELHPRRETVILRRQLSPDGRLVAAALYDGTIRVWSTVTGEHHATLVHDALVEYFAFSPDGATLVSGSWDGTVAAWSLATGGRLVHVPAHEAVVSGVTCSPDGRLVASASWGDPTVRLWDAETGAAVGALEGHNDGVHTVAWNHDGSVMASGSRDGTIRLWDPRGSCVAVLRGHSASVTRVCFSHAEPWRLASVSDDATVRIWDPASGEMLLTLAAGPTMKNVEFTRDDAHLVVDGSLVYSCRIADEWLAARDRYRDAAPAAAALVGRLAARNTGWRAVAVQVQDDDELDEILRDAALDEVLRRAAADRDRITELGARAEALLRAGRLEASRDACSALIALGGGASGEVDVALPQTLLRLAELARERERPDVAQQLLDAAAAVASRGRDTPAWREIREAAQASTTDGRKSG